MKKDVVFHPICDADLMKLSSKTWCRFAALVDHLRTGGFLREPYAKKLHGYDNLFELRVKVDGNWRLFYGYLAGNKIIMLHLVNKKRQRTNIKDIKLSLRRLKEYG